jgi:hypothetical protein
MMKVAPKELKTKEFLETQPTTQLPNAVQNAARNPLGVFIYQRQKYSYFPKYQF